MRARVSVSLHVSAHASERVRVSASARVCVSVCDFLMRNQVQVLVQVLSASGSIIMCSYEDTTKYEVNATKAY